VCFNYQSQSSASGGIFAIARSYVGFGNWKDPVHKLGQEAFLRGDTPPLYECSGDWVFIFHASFVLPEIFPTPSYNLYVLWSRWAAALCDEPVKAFAYSELPEDCQRWAYDFCLGYWEAAQMYEGPFPRRVNSSGKAFSDAWEANSGLAPKEFPQGLVGGPLSADNINLLWDTAINLWKSKRMVTWGGVLSAALTGVICYKLGCRKSSSRRVVYQLN
jgi:hypothetical protein